MMLRAALVPLLLGVSPAAADFAAIAFAQGNGAIGYATGAASREAAEAAARAACAGDCATAVWVERACGALATGDGFGWGADWGADAAEAEAKALTACRGHDTMMCRVDLSICSNG